MALGYLGDDEQTRASFVVSTGAVSTGAGGRGAAAAAVEGAVHGSSSGSSGNSSVTMNSSLPQGRWFMTGDLGAVDHTGKLYVLDRCSAIVHTLNGTALLVSDAIMSTNYIASLYKYTVGTWVLKPTASYNYCARDSSSSSSSFFYSPVQAGQLENDFESLSLVNHAVIHAGTSSLYCILNTEPGTATAAVLSEVTQLDAWAKLLSSLQEGEPEPTVLVVTGAWTASNGLLTGTLKKDRKRVVKHYTTSGALG
jgi:hypothetical protein